MFEYLKKNIKKYNEAAEYYRPTKIKLLFIAESPPHVEDTEELRYFYFEKLFLYDFLFKSIVEVILPNDFFKFRNNLVGKKELLGILKEKGCFLIDACDFPINHLPGKDADEIITDNLKNLLENNINRIADEKTKIVLVKTNIYDIFLKNKDNFKLNIINPGFSNSYVWKKKYRVKSGALPFPSIGWQTEFKEKLRELLKEFKIFNF